MIMIPGEIFVLDGRIEFNTGRDKLLITVSNFGDRPVQVGSHFHFYEVNTCLVFDRSITYGFRLDIMAGTSVRFEAGQCKDVHLVNYVGYRVVNGFRKMVMGKLESN